MLSWLYYLLINFNQKQTTNALPEQSSSYESDNLSRVTETVTSRRARVTTRAQKKRQEPIEPRQDVYGWF